MIWLRLLASGAWRLLRAIPWQVYAVAALLVAVWLYGHHQYGAGIADENARWTAAQAAADEKAKQAEATRDKAAESISDASSERARQATTETRAETAAAVERVRHVTRTIQVPASCPVGLPDRVRDEGRAAVERAKAAGRALRTGPDS